MYLTILCAFGNCKCLLKGCNFELANFWRETNGVHKPKWCHVWSRRYLFSKDHNPGRCCPEFLAFFVSRLLEENMFGSLFPSTKQSSKSKNNFPGIFTTQNMDLFNVMFFFVPWDSSPLSAPPFGSQYVWFTFSIRMSVKTLQCILQNRQRVNTLRKHT